MVENGFCVYHIVTRNKMTVGQVINFDNQQKIHYIVFSLNGDI